MKLLKFLFAGIIFGIILTKSEALSWWRIQEMFRFQSFHMYGIMGCAVFTGAISVFLIKKFKAKTIKGEEIKIEDKKFSKGNIIGGFMFGIGWALTGACPGPLYALIGSGVAVISVVILSALLGVYVFGLLKDKLPD